MERLLLVEHNLLFREGLALLLKWRTGLSSVYARSLAEAKGILDDANQKLACVIVDLDLPDGDGTELLKQLNGLPVVALIRQPVYLDDRYSATVRLLNTRDPAVGEMFVKTTGRSLIKARENLPVSEILAGRCSLATSRPSWALPRAVTPCAGDRNTTKGLTYPGS
jgi:CheY-like chemotaxis protein